MNTELEYLKGFMENMPGNVESLIKDIADDDLAALKLCPGLLDVMQLMHETTDSDPCDVAALKDQVLRLQKIMADHARAVYSLLYAVSSLISIKGEFKMYCPGPPNSNYPARLLIEYISILKKQEAFLSSTDTDRAPDKVMELDTITQRITRLTRAVDILTLADLHEDEYEVFERSISGSS
jgi:hypothetical protein